MIENDATIEQELNMHGWGWYMRMNYNRLVGYKIQPWVRHIKDTDKYPTEPPPQPIRGEDAWLITKLLESNTFTDNHRRVVGRLYCVGHSGRKIADDMNIDKTAVYILKKEALNRLLGKLRPVDIPGFEQAG